MKSREQMITEILRKLDYTKKTPDLTAHIRKNLEKKTDEELKEIYDTFYSE